MDGRDRTVLHQAHHGRELLRRQLRLGPRRLAVDQPVWAVGVEAQRPIAKDLPVHPTQRRGLATAGAVVNRGQGEQPPNLAGVLTGPRKRAKPRGVKILSKRYSWHDETLWFRHRILLRRLRESPESDTPPVGIRP